VKLPTGHYSRSRGGKKKSHRSPPNVALFLSGLTCFTGGEPECNLEESKMAQKLNRDYMRGGAVKTYVERGRKRNRGQGGEGYLIEAKGKIALRNYTKGVTHSEKARIEKRSHNVGNQKKWGEKSEEGNGKAEADPFCP